VTAPVTAIEPQAGQPARKVGRWEVIGPPDCPLMFRRELIASRWLKLLVHRFVPGATDRDPHDHPRSFVTICWRGGYDDVRADGAVDVVRAPTIRFRRAEHEHVTRVHDDGAHTVVVMGPLRREWGFWRLGRWWPWREYELTFGLGFRCEPDSASAAAGDADVSPIARVASAHGSNPGTRYV
jgi:hypothetical protein